MPEHLRQTFLIYRAAYKSAAEPRRTKILANYFGLVPWMAFAPNSWSHKIWVAATNSDPNDQASNKLLRAIAAQVSTRRLVKNRLKEAKRLAAKELLKDFMENYRTLNQYKVWHESRKAFRVRGLDSSQYSTASKSYLDPLLDKLQQLAKNAGGQIERQIIIKLLEKYPGLRPTAEYVLSKVTSIPVRYLQAR